MASASSKSLTLSCFLFAAVISSVSAVEYAVGGVVGWRLPVINETQLYNVWASRRQFHVGDSLRFRYSPVDSVLIVVKWAYYHCDPRQPIAYFHDGDTLINLDQPATMYFITDDVDRCKQGVSMMLQVTTAGNPPENPASSPSVSNPPENPDPSMAPSSSPSPELSPASSPSQLSTRGGSPELGPAYSPSQSAGSSPELSPSPSQLSTRGGSPELSPAYSPSQSAGSSPELSPSPSQLSTRGGSPELSPASSPSDATASYAVSKFVTALVIGLGLWGITVF